VSRPGILFAQMDSPPGEESEFHEWYDTEHIPDRLVLPGFVAAARYEVDGGSPRWMVVYEVDDLDAFEQPAYLTLKTDPSERTRHMLATMPAFSRFVCVEQTAVGARGEGARLGVDAYVVPAERVEGFEAGHDERLAEVAAEPGSLGVRRYRVVDGAGGPWTHLVLHELDPSAAWTPQEAAASWLYTLRSRQEAKAARPGAT
jgi:hypothetical protein